MMLDNSHDVERRKKLTLRDIADAAGVSVPTVSKVVKGRKDVSPETRARVRALLDEHGYRSPVAAHPRETIELHFDTMESSNNLQIIEGVIEASEQLDFDVVVKITPNDIDNRQWVDTVTGARHAGLILVTSTLDDEQQELFAQAGVPLVVVDPVNTPRRPLPSIGVNNFNGGYLATQHLIELGHRDIAIVRGIPSECAQARFAGYQSALTEAGLPVIAEYQVEGAFRYEEGRDGGRQLLGLAHPPTAIFASNDLEALGVLDAARAAGVDVPGALSVVGFDDNIQARTAAPRLTTVRQPFAEIGQTAARTLIQLLNGQTPPSHRLELATELVVRESTAPRSTRR
jgi:DNA-binding LacI/PurR family transcriptional regulator